MTLYSERTLMIDTENAFKVGPYIAGIEKEGHKVIKCNLGEPDFALPKHIVDAIKAALDKDMTHYCDPQGILPLREAVAKYIGESRGLNIAPDRVVVFPGGKPPIGLCQQTYCNPGDEIIYPSPGFPIYESFVKYVGAKPVPLHLDEKKGFSFTGEELARLITPRTKLIYLNFPSNPTGGVATKEQIVDIARVIKEKANPDIRIYSDEIYEQILFDGEHNFSIASLHGMEKNTVIVSGVSKSYSWTGGRIGWAVFPSAEEAQVFKNLNINYFSCIPAYNQMGAVTAITSPESKKSIHAMVSAFHERRDIVVNGLNKIEGVRCQLPKGAFYAFPNISGLCKSLGVFDAFESLPAETGAKTSPSTIFQMFMLFKYYVATMDRKSFGRIGAENMHYLRISIATGKNDLIEAVKRMDTASKDRAGFEAFVKEGKRLF
ncbi:MAG: aspartate aminotransferase [Deltaproteobacteria bacterium CG11_big_fil_rev_8_21_14_0_20_49_13]|nr:MAG: aspartate aminotransferase [Deltaproteobacteria bacterium CG11_big_fil_rev_8_21_14_0_20_49_13]